MRTTHTQAGPTPTLGLPLGTRLTVASLTPARTTMSASRMVTGSNRTGRMSVKAVTWCRMPPTT